MKRRKRKYTSDKHIEHEWNLHQVKHGQPYRLKRYAKDSFFIVNIEETHRPL